MLMGVFLASNSLHDLGGQKRFCWCYNTKFFEQSQWNKTFCRMYGLAVMLSISRRTTIKNIDKIAFKQVYISGLYVLWRSFSCIGVKYNIGVIVALTQTDFVVVRSTDCGRIMSGFQILFGQNRNQTPNRCYFEMAEKLNFLKKKWRVNAKSMTMCCQKNPKYPTIYSAKTFGIC